MEKGEQAVADIVRASNSSSVRSYIYFRELAILGRSSSVIAKLLKLKFVVGTRQGYAIRLGFVCVDPPVCGGVSGLGTSVELFCEYRGASELFNPLEV